MKIRLFVIGAVLLLIVALASQYPDALSEWNAPQIVYALAVLLLIAPGLRFVNASAAVKSALVWLALLVVLVLGYQQRDTLMAAFLPSQPQTSASGETVIMRDASGHFYANVEVNGVTLRMMIDTGASRVILTHEDASRIGLNMAALRFNRAVSTAGGVRMNATARLDAVQLGEIRVHDIRASVAQAGDLSQSLLGLSFLNALGGYKVEKDKLSLWQ